MSFSYFIVSQFQSSLLPYPFHVVRFCKNNIVVLKQIKIKKNVCLVSIEWMGYHIEKDKD